MSGVGTKPRHWIQINRNIKKNAIQYNRNKITITITNTNTITNTITVTKKIQLKKYNRNSKKHKHQKNTCLTHWFIIFKVPPTQNFQLIDSCFAQTGL